MEIELISNWNSVVTAEDTVYILGDFCWDGEDEWLRVLQQLQGSKVLIEGNHDIKQMSKPLRNKFVDVRPYLEITDSKKHIILCHYPILFYKASYNPDCVMLCGHVHNTRENDFLDKWRVEIKSTKSTYRHSCGNIYNVGCMMPYMNYTPRTIGQILDAQS